MEDFMHYDEASQKIQKPDNATPTMLSLESQSLKVIPSIPHYISSILVDLNISRNSLTELPDTIGDLVALEHLNCSRNQIRVLPLALGNTKCTK
jgi:Leucine-rich repeat (LRR) protein